jgi:hypothetical protein
VCIIYCTFAPIFTKTTALAIKLLTNQLTITMQQRYIGLTLGQVYENRQRFGANVVQVPTTENWSTMLQSVCNYWMVKLFYFISLFTIFLLPLLDLLGVQMSTKIWSILIVLPILLMIIFTIVLLNGQYNKIKRKYEIESQQDIDDLYAYGVITFAEKTEVEQRLNDWLHNETYDIPIERCKKEMEMIDRYIIWLE